LGFEFFDAVDATIDQIVTMPRAGARFAGCHLTRPFDAEPSRNFRITSSTWR
jgi:hypothetical protein